MSEFNNVISYGQFYNEGGNVDLTGAENNYVDISKVATPVDNLLKNIKSTGLNGFGVEILNTGNYYGSFQFSAFAGDNKIYSIIGVQGSSIVIPEFRFYQQATTLAYEFSMDFMTTLDAGEKLTFQISVISATLPTAALQLLNIKLAMFNLRQLGIH